MSHNTSETTTTPSGSEYLRLCIGHYDALVDKLVHLKSRASPEAVLSYIELISNFAAMNHPGRFADGAVENLALDIGFDLSTNPFREYGPSLHANNNHCINTRRRVLHVVSFVASYGGLTRTVINWIKKDPESQHSIILTCQGSVQIPPDVCEVVTLSGGKLVSLTNHDPIIERARRLRHIALHTADNIILHLVPGDIVPVVAFAGADTVPVALVNLADQCYWVGSTIADVVINLREAGVAANRDVRSTRNNVLLPIPMCESRQKLRRTEARRELGIPEQQLMLLSVGRPIKYAPSDRYNFFRTAKKTLESNVEAHIYLVGVRKEDHAASPLFTDHSRLHFVGMVKDATAYQRAADVYLEGFPFGSQTALLESILPGIPCVRVYAPDSPLLATDDIALTGIVNSPRDEDEYISSASEFIVNNDKRTMIGKLLSDRVRYYHIEEAWTENLHSIYSEMDRLRHFSMPLQATAGCNRSIDLAISAYHLTQYAKKNIKRHLEMDIRGRMMGAAYWLRQRGCYADSHRMVRMVKGVEPLDVEKVWFTAKLLPHWLMSKVL